jgi:glyoxylase-like metal-dependent hydrolase (beta-lactamase superfamily II)
MKKYLSSFLLIFFILNSGSGQDNQGWYSSKTVAPGVWQISDHGADNIYLVEGSDKAMLIDNGLGAADLHALIAKLTTKPLVIVITHGHPDHAGSNYQFQEVYIHPADSAAARAFNTLEARSGSSKAMLQGNAPAENELYRGTIYQTILLPLYDQQVFDLGARKIQVITTPGHTPGEICLLDIENKLLFTGDNSNTLVWLFLQNCLPLSKYLVSLEKLKSRLPEFTTIFPGHGGPMQADFINDQVECVKGILNKTLEAKPYQSFAGEAKISTWNRASVAFNPDNL